ncbi:MAG TPA: hypothetical protein VHT73_05975 [Thermodesulfobacteriota bacterium]|nr:hypothetical protein [Thermodesulfobacteriota bacterium]
MHQPNTIIGEGSQAGVVDAEEEVLENVYLQKLHVIKYSHRHSKQLAFSIPPGSDAKAK